MCPSCAGTPCCGARRIAPAGRACAPGSPGRPAASAPASSPVRCTHRHRHDEHSIARTQCTASSTMGPTYSSRWLHSCCMCQGHAALIQSHSEREFGTVLFLALAVRDNEAALLHRLQHRRHCRHRPRQVDHEVRPQDRAHIARNELPELGAEDAAAVGAQPG